MPARSCENSVHGSAEIYESSAVATVNASIQGYDPKESSRSSTAYEAVKQMPTMGDNGTRSDLVCNPAGVFSFASASTERLAPVSPKILQMEDLVSRAKRQRLQFKDGAHPLVGRLGALPGAVRSAGAADF